MRFFLSFLCLALPLFSLPEELTIRERYFSWLATFDVESSLDSIATVHKRLSPFSLPTFEIESFDPELYASAAPHFFSWGLYADVLDSQQRKIGAIQEELVRLFPWAEYKLFDAEEELLAVAKMNLIGTYFEVYHPDAPDQLIATISRPFLRLFRDSWTLNLLKPKAIDPRILILMTVLQTDKDNLDRLRNEIFSQFRHELDDYEGKRITGHP